MEKLRELKDGGIFRFPAIVSAAIFWPRGIDRASAVLPQKLAGIVSGLDQLLPLAIDLDNMARFKFPNRQSQECREPPDVSTAYGDIAGHPATERRAFQAIQLLAVAQSDSLAAGGVTLERFQPDWKRSRT